MKFLIKPSTYFYIAMMWAEWVAVELEDKGL